MSGHGEGLNQMKSSPAHGEQSNSKAAAKAADGHISVRDVGKIYDPEGAHVVALEHCTLDIPAGDFVAIVGPSGCGKSTLLNIVAGFDQLTSGEVYLDGAPLATVSRPPRPGPDRVVVFQHGALFPWKTVLENVTYGPVRQHQRSQAEANAIALDFLDRCGGLARIAHTYPTQLSSGMQRRVEIIRALINEPKILLLDEPFRAMDTVSKTTMHQHLLDLYQQTGKTTIFITHDLEEAIFLADTVVVMSTRPGTVKLLLDIDLPRPRTPETMVSDRYLDLKQKAISQVREEAMKAFQRGERELA